MPGDYNIIATKGNKTSIIYIAVSADKTNGDILLPKGNLSYEVEIKGNTPEVVVSGLDAVAKENDPTNTDKVKVKLVVQSKSENEAPTNDVTAIKTEAIGKTLDYLDMQILKSKNEEIPTNITDTNNNIIAVVVPFKTEGRTEIVVYRYHNNAASAFEKLDIRPTSDYKDGKYYVGDGFIVIYTGKFSTYAIGYAEPKTITFDANGGSITPSSAKTNSKYKLDTLPTPKRSGSYSFDSWYTSAKGGTAVTADTVFASDSTIYAHWSYTGIGFSDGYYIISATSGVGGSISTGKYVSVREGDAAGFTMTPNKGYVIANVKIDGKSVGSVTNYVFSNVRENHTIEVTFKVSGGHVNPQTGVTV